MSKRQKASKQQRDVAKPTERQPAAERPALVPRPTKRRPWFLAAAISLEVVWLAFLLVLALRS
jgi:hypothetical protein